MRRVIVLGVVIYILLVLALAGTNGTILAFMLPFMVYLGMGFFFSPGTLNISVSRELSSDRVFPSEQIHVQVTVINQGSNIELLQIEDLLPEGLEVIGGNSTLLTALPSKDRVEINYTVTGPRGLYHFRGVKISISDTLAVRTKKSHIDTHNRLFIQPEPIRLGQLNIRPRRTRVYAGHIPARVGGSAVEFFGVREYQQGDPLRWINWRASARHHQKFFINEFEQERVADVGLILDTRQKSEITLENGKSLFEFSVQATSALAESFLKDGNRVGLLVYGTLLDWTLPDYGKIQRERISQRLATAHPGESLVFGELENLPTRLLPPKSQIVFISPLQESDLPVLIGLRARGYAVMVISPNPISFELSQVHLSSKNSKIAARLAGIERQLMIRKLSQAGIQILDWHVEVPLDQAIKVILMRPALMSTISV